MIKASILIPTLFLFSCTFKQTQQGKIPKFDMLLMDSSTKLNTASIPYGRPIVILYFSPECEYCQQETELIIKNINTFKKILFYFISTDSIKIIRKFNRHYKLDQYNNITLANDYTFSMIRLFSISTTPYLIVYDENQMPNFVVPGELEGNKLIQLLSGI